MGAAFREDPAFSAVQEGADACAAQAAAVSQASDASEAPHAPAAHAAAAHVPTAFAKPLRDPAAVSGARSAYGSDDEHYLAQLCGTIHALGILGVACSHIRAASRGRFEQEHM